MFYCFKEGCFLPSMDDDLVVVGNISANFTRGKPVLLGANANEGFLKLMKFLTKVSEYFLLFFFCFKE